MAATFFCGSPVWKVYCLMSNQAVSQVTSQGEVQRLVDGQTKLWATLDQVVEAMLQTEFSTVDACWFSGKGRGSKAIKNLSQCDSTWQVTHFHFHYFHI